MNLRKVLRTLVLAEVGLAILSIAQHFMGRGLLPPELQKFETERLRADQTTVETVTLALSLPVTALVIIGWIGLWRFRWWGRGAYTLAWPLSLAAAVVWGPDVASWLGRLVGDLSVLTGGLILGVAWFSDLRHTFARRGTAEPGTAAAAAEAAGSPKGLESATRGAVRAHLLAGGLAVLSIASLGSAYLFPIVIRDSAKGPGPAAFSAGLIVVGSTLFAVGVWLLLYVPASMLADRMTKQRLGRLAWSSALCVAVLWVAILCLVIWSAWRPHILSVWVLLVGAVVVGFGGGIYTFLRSGFLDQSKRKRLAR